MSILPKLVATLAFLLASSAGFSEEQESEKLAALQLHANQGDPLAQLNLGAAYDHGLHGLQSSTELAIQWYRSASEQGLARAQFNLAHLLISEGSPTQQPEALQWMRQAAEQGLVDAEYMLGLMYLYGGSQMQPDPKQAYHWLSLAAEHGHPNAIEIMQQNTK